ncbi:phasin family protein [Pokkaliibacter sp. CJK22405]|uniref:phasin family protein n=1 Tax=Pokkaliibacter sp. CJK22405 TaxID=3384615 RepID=UPI00398505A9
MFEPLNEQMKQAMGPMQEMVKIQTALLESLTRQQMECTQQCVEATLAQTKELTQCAKPEDLYKLQQAYAKELEGSLKLAGERNMAALNDAREALFALTKKSTAK